MINQIKVNNFKCFELLQLDFSDVNILTGLNGMGKSTIIQMILLFKQSIKSLRFDRELILNGDYISLGIGRDVLYEKSREDLIRFALTSDNDTIDFDVMYESAADRLKVKSGINSDAIDKMGKILEKVFFLSAYRIEPQNLYRIKNEQELQEINFGNSGEYAIQYLKIHEEDYVNNIGLEDVNQKITIQEEVRKWMDKISPGISPVIDINTSARTAELKYEYIENNEKTNAYKSFNVGFGITYVLPVVVSLITAQKGDVVLIENPEAHIHPKGQRMLGELIAAVAKGGVQIILETHSDHILNGIRISVKKGIIEPGKTSCFFFYKDKDDDCKHKVKKPVIDKNGRLSEWPDDFFDEWDNALLELL